MTLVTLHDKTEIETFLRGNVALHIYSLGDLDPFFWPYTQWYGFQQGGQLQAVALLYVALSPPVLLALAPPHALDALRALLTRLVPLLPKQVYTHLSLGVEDIFQPAYNLHSHGIHRKMILANPTPLQNYLTPDVVRLTADHLPEIHALYAESYPDHAFDPRMLETRQFFGLWRANRLVSIAGIHVYSPAYRVAAIGNVTTLPAFRNQGLGKAVVATLTRSLLDSVDDIGLNVKEDNRAALHSYQKLGFVVVDSYHEMMATTP
ncbi:MAG: GNAT family N-acetyltransferase [Anaerolineales bacterium]|nr:GNAT family N-acetyltransferase [Anaerolineales bacterium]